MGTELCPSFLKNRDGGAILRRMSEVTVPEKITVMLSNHHVHLRRETLDVLFGEGAELHRAKELGMGQYACEETVKVSGPKGTIGMLRVIGPLRGLDQVELLAPDVRKLGVDAPVAESGHLDDACELVLEGPCGSVALPCGIIAARHVHLCEATAGKLGLAQGDRVSITSEGIRSTTFHNVIARIHKGDGDDVIHLDFDEGNAAGFRNGDAAELVKQ